MKRRRPVEKQSRGDDARPIGRQVGERIAGVRRQRGLTLDALAGGTGLTRSYLSKLERGRTSISVDNLRSVAHFLGVEMVFFFERNARTSILLTRAGRSAGINRQSVAKEEVAH